MSDYNTDNDAMELTPELVAKEGFYFSIPLYQRLFEWTENEISLLLSDLKDAYAHSKNEKKPYYIGLLTTSKLEHEGKSVYSLVDGQQRFTVMMLMSVVMKENWCDFHGSSNSPRLSFFARPEDNKYIRYLCSDDTSEDIGYENIKMKNAVNCIDRFIKKEFPTDIERKEFINYTFKYLTFFVSILPSSYTLADLNKYFETMNSTGKSLENHEQLKVDLLRKLPKQKGDQEKYTRLWDVVADLNTELVRKTDEEKNFDKKKRLLEAIKVSRDSPLKLFNDKSNFFLNDIYINSNEEDKDHEFIIQNINESKEQPKYELGTTEDKAMFSFPLFLLLVLYKTIPDINKITNIAEFFKISNLRKTFKTYLPDEDKFVIKFFNNMVLYRLYLDCFFIRLEDEDKAYPYTLKNYTYNEDDERDEDKIDLKIKQLKYFQSMLFVSSTAQTFYRWIIPGFEFLDSKDDVSNVTATDFLKELKHIDNQIHPIENLDTLKLSYPNIDRYWFWRTDYYLWENKEAFFKDGQLEVANNYVFRRNRSIEHIAPQTPKTNASDEFKWDETTKDIGNSFGNLCMISSGQNSSLQNEPYSKKRAHVEAYVKAECNGTIESLKMLKIYSYDKWSKETIKEHNDEMLELLKNSYKL